ncbi:glycoside hydrolase domain-containing protein [Streptomyces litchfieldiae]|uniref:DUF1906 domain-containing protein n=1 Tax=Streptomyces litchfieldiae TaxID=3075543 RepID=A0ABU2MKA9_9ACTN|nr:glycoside hydrolase domain-containing protein [Streptomyces sp. DSM 44938]MDT0342034.1 DUF1906 domain-containing protein [Streptomyces sp. DSM 44938]
MRYVHHTGRAPSRQNRPSRFLPLLTLPTLLILLTLLPSTPALADTPAPPPTTGDLAAAGAEIYRGPAFDTCDAPDLDTMRAWLASPYRAVGVYIGGRGRGCPGQPHLTPDWVTAVHDLGWRLLPLYVGSQSPCTRLPGTNRVPIDAERPREQGAAEAQDAIAAAQALGLAPGSPIYLDMEDYDHQDPGCAATTLAFVQGFTHRLDAAGFIPGYYSSATSGIAHLENARLAGTPDLPEVLWYARWSTEPTLHAEPALDPAAWQPDRRIHQYAGDVPETHGGRELLIDRNLVAAPVAVLADDHQGNP